MERRVRQGRSPENQCVRQKLNRRVFIMYSAKYWRQYLGVSLTPWTLGCQVIRVSASNQICVSRSEAEMHSQHPDCSGTYELADIFPVKCIAVGCIIMSVSSEINMTHRITGTVSGPSSNIRLCFQCLSCPFHVCHSNYTCSPDFSAS